MISFYKLKKYAEQCSSLFKKVRNYNCFYYKAMYFKIYLSNSIDNLPADYTNNVLIIVDDNDVLIIANNSRKRQRIESFNFIDFLDYVSIFWHTNTSCNSSKQEVIREMEYQLDCLNKSIKSLKK